MRVKTVKYGNSQTMATRMARKIMLGLSLITAAIALLVLAIFTYHYASRLSPLSFIASILWLLWLFGFTWCVSAGRLFHQLGPRLFGPESRWASASLQPGSIAVVIIGTLAGVGWMFYAQAQQQGSIAQSIHWFGQLLILVLTLAALFKFCVNLRSNVTNNTSTLVLDNSSKRNKLIHDINHLTSSTWLKQYPNGTTGNRLRASLTWLADEIQNAIPEHGFVLAETSISHFIDEQHRLLTFIQDLEKQKTPSDGHLTEAERRVLESISKSSRLSQKLSL
jgi:hypothetical protein